jgi:hypothetical protein
MAFLLFSELIETLRLNEKVSLCITTNRDAACMEIAPLCIDDVDRLLHHRKPSDRAASIES